LPTPALQRAAYNRLAHIGGVKLAGLDRLSFESDRCCGGAPYTLGRVGRLKLGSARANSVTGLSGMAFTVSLGRQTSVMTSGRRKECTYIISTQAAAAAAAHITK